MRFVMSQMAGPSILAQSKSLLYGLFHFAGKKHKSPLENIGEERKLGLQFNTKNVFFVHRDVHWLPLKAQIYFAGLLPQTEIRALKLDTFVCCGGEKKMRPSACKKKEIKAKNNSKENVFSQLNRRGGLEAKLRRRETELHDSLVYQNKEIRKHRRLKQRV